jgi:predicted short-subunit dehydrogenase-like oxidoreductase (DUF2520 family)
MTLSVTIIGAGNVATHLAKTLSGNGFVIKQIYSRTSESAAALANKLQTGFTNKTGKIDTSADMFFVALKDSVIDEVLSEIDFKNKLLVHCSGSLPLSGLNKYSKNTAVFYPLQTFSKEREIDFKRVPVFIEANTSENEKKMLEIAQKLSDTVSIANSETRKYLHISAVFACNFVNHFYTISSELLKVKGISFDVLKSLIKETAQKIETVPPPKAQTGPAVRFDENIISSHLAELNGESNYKELYQLVSKSIFEHHKK